MFNKVILVGNLTRDVDLRYLDSGATIAKFGLAVNRVWKDRNSGEKKEEVMYIDINIFGRSAEIANQYLAKGKKILVEGRLQFEQWQDQNGQKRSKHSVSAESFQFLDSRGDSGGGNHNDYSNSHQSHENSSPFDMNGSSQSSQSPGNHPGGSMGDIDIDDDIPF